MQGNSLSRGSVVACVMGGRMWTRWILGWALAASVLVVGGHEGLCKPSSQRRYLSGRSKTNQFKVRGFSRGVRGGWSDDAPASELPATVASEAQATTEPVPKTSEPSPANPDSVEAADLVAPSPEDGESPSSLVAPVVPASQPEADTEAAPSAPEATAGTRELSTVRTKRAADQKDAVKNGSSPDGSSDQYNARIPWLITSRMRRILIDELHYLPEEVDAMSASVATVVVNKRLERPSKGMPAAFRKDYQMSPKEKIRSRLAAAVAAIKKHPWKAAAGTAGALVAGAIAFMAVRRGEEEGFNWWWQEEEEEEEEELPWYDLAIARLRDTLPFGGSR